LWWCVLLVFSFSFSSSYISMKFDVFHPRRPLGFGTWLYRWCMFHATWIWRGRPGVYRSSLSTLLSVIVQWVIGCFPTYQKIYFRRYETSMKFFWSYVEWVSRSATFQNNKLLLSIYQKNHITMYIHVCPILKHNMRSPNQAPKVFV
jgi:hypothetical protein